MDYLISFAICHGQFRSVHCHKVDRQARTMTKQKGHCTAIQCTCKMKVDTHKSVGVYFFRSKIRAKGGIGMGKKGTPHRKWSKEEKLYYIHLHLDEHLSVMEIERRHGVRNSLVSCLGEAVSGRRRRCPGAKERKPVRSVAHEQNTERSGSSEAHHRQTGSRDRPFKYTYIYCGRSWCKEGIRYWQRKEYEVIEELKGKYPVNFCARLWV